MAQHLWATSCHRLEDRRARTTAAIPMEGTAWLAAEEAAEPTAAVSITLRVTEVQDLSAGAEEGAGAIIPQPALPAEMGERMEATVAESNRTAVMGQWPQTHSTEVASRRLQEERLQTQTRAVVAVAVADTQPMVAMDHTHRLELQVAVAVAVADAEEGQEGQDTMTTTLRQAKDSGQAVEAEET